MIEGLLFLHPLAHREDLLFEGTGQLTVPMPELVARQQGLKAFLPLRERLLRRQGSSLPEAAAPRPRVPYRQYLLSWRLLATLPESNHQHLVSFSLPALMV